jgi:hypothetical protein
LSGKPLKFGNLRVFFPPGLFRFYSLAKSLVGFFVAALEIIPHNAKIRIDTIHSFLRGYGMHKRNGVLLIVLICFVFGSSNGWAQMDKPTEFNSDSSSSSIPKEPGWGDPSYRGWEVMGITGLISTYYDLDLDGKLDYMVVRKIIRKAAASEVTIEEAIKLAQFDGMSVFFSHPVVYFTKGNPMFYCLGVDYRKNCNDIWVDIAEDGLNGNEERYSLSTPSLGVR